MSDHCRQYYCQSKMLFVCLFLLTVIFAIIKVYFKLTTGICKCSRHLVGKVVIITGSNTGIGYETAKDLAERGARVILACRNKEKGIAAQTSIISSTGNNDVYFQELDLANLASVRTFAESIIKTETRIHILINNAGVFAVDNFKTVDGLSRVMQTNYFGHFLLTSLLLPLLKSSAPSRIINVSSMAYVRGKINFDNLNEEKETNQIYSRLRVYQKTKMCNVLMTLELARRLKGTGVTSNCLHPGGVATNMLLQIEKIWWPHTVVPLLKLFYRTPSEGAQTTIFLAVSPEVEGVSGKYFSDCREANLSEAAQDVNLAPKLWDVSEKIVELK